MSTIPKLQKEINLLKKQFDLLRSFDPDYEKNIDSRLSMKLTYNSNAIEWNTLTELETKLVVEDGMSIAGKKMIELYEAENHAKALEYTKRISKKTQIKNIDEKIICEIHKIILTNISYENAGVYRNVPVRITGSQSIMPNYAKVPKLMSELLERLQNSNDDIIKIACDLHYKFVSIHPFVDGNGRTARLLFNLVLLIWWYPLTIIEVVDRKEYLTCLEKAQTTWIISDYYFFMFRAIIKSLKIYIDDLK